MVKGRWLGEERAAELSQLRLLVSERVLDGLLERHRLPLGKGSGEGFLAHSTADGQPQITPDHSGVAGVEDV